MLKKAVTIVDSGRSYAVCSDNEFEKLLKKLGVEDIMNVEDKLIPLSFESLVDGGKYTTNIATNQVIPDLPASNVADNDDQGSSSPSAKNPEEDQLNEIIVIQDDSDDDSSTAKLLLNPTKQAESPASSTNQKQGTRSREQPKLKARHHDSDSEEADEGTEHPRIPTLQTTTATRQQGENSARNNLSVESVVHAGSAARIVSPDQGHRKQPKRKSKETSQAASPGESPVQKVSKRRKTRVDTASTTTKAPSMQQKQQNLHPKPNQKESKDIEKHLRGAQYFYGKRMFEKALENYRKALSKQLHVYGESHEHVASTHVKIGMTLHDLGNEKGALKAYEKAQEINLEQNRQINIADVYNKMGYVYQDRNEYEEAMEMHKKAKETQESFYGQGKSHESVAWSYAGIAETYSGQGKEKEALGAYKKALDIREKTLGKKAPLVAATHALIADIHDDEGDYDLALETFQKAEKIYSSLKTCKIDLADVYNRMGHVHKHRYEYEEATEMHEKALEIQRESLGKEHKDVATTISSLAHNLALMGRHKDAIEKFQKALSIRRRELKDKPPTNDIAETFNDLGKVCKGREDYPKALEMHQKALKIQLDTLDENDPVIALTYNHMGNVLENQGKYTAAAKMYQSALRIQLEKLDKNDTRIAETQNNIGCLYSQQGNNLLAMASFRKALKIQKESGEDCPLDTAKTYFNMGCVLEDQQNYDEAMKMYGKAYGIQNEKNHPSTAETLNSMGSIYRLQQKYDEAMREHKRALKIQRERFGDRHVDLGETYSLMGDLLTAQEKYEEAQSHYQDALSIYKSFYDARNEKLDDLTRKLAECQNQIERFAR